MAAAAATASQCSRSQSQVVGLRAVTSKQGVVPPEVAIAAAGTVAAAKAPPALPPLSPIPPSLCPHQPTSYFPASRTAAAAAAAAAAVQRSRSLSQVVGLQAVTPTWPRPLPSLVSELAAKYLAFALS